MIIYKATNLINGKSYVGKSEQSLKSRIRGHLRSVKKGSRQLIHCAIRKYGIANFSWEIIFECENSDELSKTEIKRIAELGVLTPNGYNIHEGGKGGDTISHHPRRLEIMAGIRSYLPAHLPYEQKLRISKSLTGRKRPEEVKLKIGKKLKGRFFSDETKDRMSKAHIGKVPGNKGKHLSAELIEKMRIASTGKRRRSILTEEQAKEIKSLIKGNSTKWLEFYAEISKRFGVSPSTIRAIRYNRLWRGII